MTARNLAGQPVAEAIRARTAELVVRMASEGTSVRIAVVLATDNEATAWYVRSIERAAAQLGVDCQVVDLTGSGQEQLSEAITALNEDSSVHGIILQTPLPP
ncbi:MAG: tetrahydrofolate dehydrogenase/cyclohydrolase catalytic domain-containing protein, partial [Glutamicibacter sp.]